MKKINWLLAMLVFVLMPTMQSCNFDDDGYSIGDFAWDWATVRTSENGNYYLEGDKWGDIIPLATSIPWYRPTVDGDRVVVFFNPLADIPNGVNVKIEGVREVLTKNVEEMTATNASEFGNDPITIYEGYMWLGGKYLNIIFQQDLPRSQKHRISLVWNKDTYPTSPMDANGYVNLELRYNTFNDVSDCYGWARVSYNLNSFYPATRDDVALKGFKVTIHSKENGEGRVIVLDLNHPVGVPEEAKDAQEPSYLQ